MARAEWSRYSGDDVELAIAIMLSCENSGAIRVKPSRGDKGIDILVPIGDGYEVYQVKSFTGQIDSNRKRQIKKSWARLNEYIEESSFNVVAWYLVMPEDPTIGNLDWLAELTKSASFPCDWRGLSFVDGLASRHPEVIDYYFRDGKERLESALREFMGLTHLGEVAEGHTPAVLVESSLRELHQLINATDPHYHYDLAIDTLHEGEAPPTPRMRPMLVAAQVAVIDNQCVTVSVIAKYPEAVDDRPVPINIRLDLRQHPEAREQLRRMVEYGVGFQTPEGIVSGTVSLPGGLGGSYENMTARFGASYADNAEPFALRLQVNDEDGAVLATSIVQMERPTVGMANNQRRSAGREQHGAYAVETLFDSQSGKFGINFGSLKLAGTRPARVRDGVFFLSQLKSPNTLQVGPEFGPLGQERVRLPDDNGALAAQCSRTLRLLDALAAIQEHTSIQIRTPDLASVEAAIKYGWLEAAELLRGQPVELRWNGPLVIKGPGDSESIPTDFEVSTFYVEEDLSVDIGDVRISLGAKLTQLPGARLIEAHSSLEDRSVSLTYEPTTSDVMTVRLKPT